MKRKLSLALAGLASTALIGVGLIAAAAPANAAWDQCASGSFCAYQDANGLGGLGQWGGNASSWGGMNNRATSLWNNGNLQNVRAYEGQSYSGLNLIIYRGADKRHTDLSWDGTGGVPPLGHWNDNLESHQWV